MIQRESIILCLVFAVIASTGVSVPSLAQDVIINGSFEDPRITPGVPDKWVADAGLLPGWSTTASDNTVEVWTDGYRYPCERDQQMMQNRDPPYAYEGDQHMMLNGNEARDLYQDVAGIAAGSVLGFGFAHRSNGGNSTMRLAITDLGGDGALGGGDDTVLFSKDYLSNYGFWRLNSDAIEPPIFALGNTIRLSFLPLDGLDVATTPFNLLDSVTFGTGFPVELQSFSVTRSTLSEDESVQTE